MHGFSWRQPHCLNMQHFWRNSAVFDSTRYITSSYVSLLTHMDKLFNGTFLNSPENCFIYSCKMVFLHANHIPQNIPSPSSKIACPTSVTSRTLQSIYVPETVRVSDNTHLNPCFKCDLKNTLETVQTTCASSFGPNEEYLGTELQGKAVIRAFICHFIASNIRSGSCRNCSRVRT